MRVFLTTNDAIPNDDCVFVLISCVRTWFSKIRGTTHALCAVMLCLQINEQLFGVPVEKRGQICWTLLQTSMNEWLGVIYLR